MRYDLNVMKPLGSVDETMTWMVILDKNGENLKFDLDLWPWNDLEGEPSLAGTEISLIPNNRWDMMEMWWN